MYTLQQLIGDLITLSLAYPDTTPVRVEMHESMAEVVGVSAQNTSDDLFIQIEAQQ